MFEISELDARRLLSLSVEKIYDDRELWIIIVQLVNYFRKLIEKYATVYEC